MRLQGRVMRIQGWEANDVTKGVGDDANGAGNATKLTGDKTKESVKWSKRSAIVNAKRRLQYKLNPIGKQLINQMYYYSQCDI